MLEGVKKTLIFAIHYMTFVIQLEVGRGQVLVGYCAGYIKRLINIDDVYKQATKAIYAPMSISLSVELAMLNFYVLCIPLPTGLYLYLAKKVIFET